MLSDPLLQTDLPLPGRRQGKVRDLYECRVKSGESALLLVASDRISAFDVVMPSGIPMKGIVLTQLSRFWFDMIERELGDRVRHHLISTEASDIEGLGEDEISQLQGRVMIGRKAEVIPIECVVRGYLAGSGWKEYRQSQTVCGVELPSDLPQCGKLPAPIFTPATKAQTGHDENISFDRACEIVGSDLMTTLRDLSIAIYQMGHDYASKRGIILADTKFEFALPLESGNNVPILIDEVMTPDSSRFWPADQYKPGRDQVSFDKQYVRNYLEELVDQGRWNKEPPGPILPREIIDNTTKKYLESYRILTGNDLKV